ncbi:MAG: hypothetical protein ACQEP9_01650 [Bacillota bacterium]
MKKISDNYLSVFEKIYNSETIKEEQGEEITWRSKYLASLHEVVIRKENNDKGRLGIIKNKLIKTDLFNTRSNKLKKSPLIHFLFNLLSRETQ